LLDILCAIINKVLELGDLPKQWKEFYIVMIEKKAGEATLENLDVDMRPISIINEYAKLINKILADRLSQILLENDVIEPAQRTFLRNGSTHQCVSTLINIFEDAAHKRSKSSQSTFYFTSYDQKKAYDSLQKYSIRASLKHFNMPDSFIKFVLNNHSQLRACFKTFFGLSNPFEILNGLQQGNHLAPLIFILFTDALHEGLRDPPLKEVKFSAVTGFSSQAWSALPMTSQR
jgi:hypothetical protein